MEDKMCAVSYKELGLVNTVEMFKKAVDGGYAVPAYNFNNMEQLQAIIMACVETNSPVILQVSKGARDYANATLLRNMAKGAVEYAHELGKDIPIVLHLDHGSDFEVCKQCIDNGFSSVMIDGSHLPYEENVALTKKVVEYAHSQKDYVTVEGELGVLAGIEDDVVAAHSTYTQPSEVIDFVSKTGVDSLAISIGTSHGANKFKPEQCTRNAEGILVPPPLRFDILEEIEQKLPGFPIVLHGSSSVPADLVEMVNKYGGKMTDAVGIPEELFLLPPSLQFVRHCRY
jgi:fructose-bisphosphate aldolase class II